MGTRAPTSAGTIPDHHVASVLDLRADRRLALTVQMGFVAAVLLLVGAALLLHLPLDSSWPAGVVLAVTVGACVAYMVVHELTHGAALLLLTGVRPTFALRLPYLVTGSRALLGRRVAVTVSLAPMLLWGAVLLALLAVVPADLFLTVYVVLGLNLAGSAGDVLQACVVGRLPQGALVRDDGRQTVVLLPAG